MPYNEGATAFQVAKLLKLDTSTAWRRLRVATNKGFIANMETRIRQPGRYRVTDQEVEAEELLPSPGVLKEGVQTAQTCKPTRKRQVIEELNVCATVCTIAPIASPPHAYRWRLPRASRLPKSALKPAAMSGL
jgi:hypothetical protein